MWSSIMAPTQGHHFISLPGKQQQQRDFGMLCSILPIATGKSFKNPNFVNNFDQYQATVKPIDSSTKNYPNSCHSYIIDSIKEKCPEIIPSVEEDTKPLPETNSDLSAMCLANNKSETKTKAKKRDHMQRRKRQSGKNSKQNQKRQEIKEMLQEEDLQVSLNNSTDICSSPNIHILHLKDFIMEKPSPNKCSPSKMMVQSIEIPINNKTNSEMFLTITKTASSPNRCRQYSVTDSEDSFIVFDHEGNEEHLKDDLNEYSSVCPINKESLCCRRLRKPSECESEDSFILFEPDETAEDRASRQDIESDYCFDSSDEENDHESNFDETDSSFSIVSPKKVRFASDHSLCEVHPMIKWSYAYQAARKGPWEMYARDRCRFRERVYKVEQAIIHVFDPQHRGRIYKERFENL